MQTEFLHPVSIFKDLSDSELDALMDVWTLRAVAPRERIVSEGALMHEFYIVCSGTVHVRSMAQDHEVLLARIGPGGFFGEINLFDEDTATASVYSMGEVQIASAPNAALRDFMAAQPAIGYKITASLLREVSRRLRHTNERLVHSMFWASNKI